jgi:hypothetical protein
MPWPSTAMAVGDWIEETNVVMSPSGVTLRIVFQNESVMKTLPRASTATASGRRRASTARPPSPLLPVSPDPATTVMVEPGPA